MAMSKPRKRKNNLPHVPPAGRSKDRRLVPIDQAPLRRKVATECSRMMARVEKTRMEWNRFEREDQPAFGRWMAAAFGGQLTRLRDLEALIREKETLVQEVESEMFFSGANPRRAYQRVMQARTNPQPVRDHFSDAFPPPGDEADFGKPDEPDEFDQEIMFEEVLRAFMGINPDKLDDASYEKMFQEFKDNVFGGSTSEPPPFFHGIPEPQTPLPHLVRVKEIYRVLVRRLHPDLRADKDAAVSALWHEVQEAYNAGNLDRLEMLLALTDIESNNTGDHTSLFQMQSVLAELRRALNALQKSLRNARKDRAWNFARTSDHAILQSRIQRELESEEVGQKHRLADLEALLANWSRPPANRTRKSKPHARLQEEFFF